MAKQSTFDPDAVDPFWQTEQGKAILAKTPRALDLQPTTKPVTVVPRGQTLAEWRSRFE